MFRISVKYFRASVDSGELAGSIQSVQNSGRVSVRDDEPSRSACSQTDGCRFSIVTLVRLLEFELRKYTGRTERRGERLWISGLFGLQVLMFARTSLSPRPAVSHMPGWAIPRWSAFHGANCQDRTGELADAHVLQDRRANVRPCAAGPSRRSGYCFTKYRIEKRGDMPVKLTIEGTHDASRPGAVGKRTGEFSRNEPAREIAVCRVCVAGRGLPAQQVGAPGQAAAAGVEHNQIVVTDAVRFDRLVQCDWHRGGRGVAVAVDVGENLVLSDTQTIGDRVEDAQ